MVKKIKIALVGFLLVFLLGGLDCGYSYTTPVSALATRHYSFNTASKAIDDDTATYWKGPLSSTTDWIRFVIADDTWTTPTTAYAIRQWASTPDDAIDDDTGSHWYINDSGSTTDFIIVGMTSDTFTTPTSATASTNTGFHEAAKAYDDSETSYWQGDSTDSEWITFDMGTRSKASRRKPRRPPAAWAAGSS